MSKLIVRDRVIDEDILNILAKVQGTCKNGKLSQYKLSGSGIAVTCPHHAAGLEKHPSCYINLTNDEVPFGYIHCFTCNFSGTFSKFIGECFNRDEDYGESWLISNYANDYVKRELVLPEINLEKEQEIFLEESILDSFRPYHPYMTKRKLSPEVIEKFQIKYDPELQAIVFPVRDVKGRLKFLTKRSINSKMFYIDKSANKKDIYLLNEIVKNNISEVIVCESQINALTCWSYGYPAIALFGAGTTKEQIDELNKTGIKHYILAYDPDQAGDKGKARFKKYIRKDVFVDSLELPKGKDINDLSKEELDNLISLQVNTNLL